MKVSLFKNLLIICLTQLLIYLGLFVLIPNLIMKGFNDWIWVSVACLWTGLISGFSVLKLVPKIGYWLLGVIILWILILVYHPRDLYGIGGGNYVLDLFPSYIDALLFALIIFLVQCFIKVISVMASKV